MALPPPVAHRRALSRRARSRVDAHLIGQLVDVVRPPGEVAGQDRAHLAHGVQQAVARPLVTEVGQHRLDQPLPVGLPHPLVDAQVAQHRELVVSHAHVDQHPVARRGPVHAEPLEDRHRARHRLPGAVVVEMHADLGRGARLLARDGPRHGVEVRLAEERPHPPRMPRHHQLPLEPPPPKLPPPPPNPPPLLPPPPPQPPPPHPPPRPPSPPPMNGPPQPLEPPVQPRRRREACCMRFWMNTTIRRPTKSSPSTSRQPKPWVGWPRFGPGGRWYVPAIARSMASRPAPMPSARRPSRKRGATMSRRMDDETASVSWLSRP